MTVTPSPSNTDRPAQRVAIACGGTGGHFFPGTAVGKELMGRGSEVMLIASQKDVDREMASGFGEAEVKFLPAVGLVKGKRIAFCFGLIAAVLRCFKWFYTWRPDVVLVMGGFTSVGPALVGRLLGATVCLHEANSIPGRANRFLARFCHRVFVGFPQTKSHFSNREIVVTGTPVRSQFSESLAAESDNDLGLNQEAPILLVMGGSQGAQAINDLMLRVAPLLAKRRPELQFVHLTGKNPDGELRRMYQKLGRPFYLAEFYSDAARLVQMASAVLSRAGASSLAEYATVGLPALLVPYPNAVDDHQKLNALNLVNDGAAFLAEQDGLDHEVVALQLEQLLFDQAIRGRIHLGLRHWSGRESARLVANGLETEVSRQSGHLLSGESKARGKDAPARGESHLSSQRLEAI